MKTKYKVLIAVSLIIGFLLGFILGMNYAYDTCIEVGTEILNIELKADYASKFQSLITYLTK